MLTPKMYKIADAIAEFINKNYEQEYLETVFFGGATLEDVIIQVLVFCCRYAYLANAEKHPLSYYIEQEGLENELARKERERTIKYVKEKFELINARTKQTIGDSSLSPDLEFVKKNNRYSGYAFSAYQYWENKNIHDMRLVKSIVERRISSSKKISNKRFVAISEAYDWEINEMKKQFRKDPERTVFSSIQFYTLQTKYAFDFYYELAARMEELGVKMIPNMNERLMIASGTYKCMSPLPDICPEYAADVNRRIDYPLIVQRRNLIDKIICVPEGGFIDLVLVTYNEVNVLANAVRTHMCIDGLILPLFFAQRTSLEDWASVFERYNVFQTFVPKKEWTDTRIKYVRNIYDRLSVDYKSLKHPENRP